MPPVHDITPPTWSSNFSDHDLLPVTTAGNAGLIDRSGRTVVATTTGELTSIEDPVEPGSFWITTIPYRSALSPNGSNRPPYQPACYDSSGNLIWDDSTLTQSTKLWMTATACGLLSGLLIAVSGKHRSPTSPA